MLAAQAGMGLLVMLLAWAIAGFDAAASAFLGAAAYLVPNALFAARVLLGFLAGGQRGSLAFFRAEAVKLLAVAAAVVWMAWQWGQWLTWPAFLLGLLAATKGYLVLLALRRLP